MAYAKTMLKRKLRVNGGLSDVKIPGADAASVAEGSQRLLPMLMATLPV
jgi:hypothetical protein